MSPAFSTSLTSEKVNWWRTHRRVSRHDKKHYATPALDLIQLETGWIVGLPLDDNTPLNQRSIREKRAPTLSLSLSYSVCLSLFVL